MSMPEDPAGRADQEAIAWQEQYESFLRNGFDTEQAFELVRTQAEAYWNAAQYHRHEIHGCPLCAGEVPDPA